MKSIIFITVALGFLLLGACKRGSSIVSSDGTYHVEINYSGDVRFSDDEKSIQSITPDGYLRFRKNGRELFAKSNFHGEVSCEIYEQGEKLSSGDHHAKAFIAEAIREMIVNGFDATGRISRLYKKGGSEAVLSKVGETKNDQINSMYLEYLLSTNNLTQDELLRTAKNICLVMENDFEKARLIRKFSAAYCTDSVATRAWIDAIACMRNDFEKANTLKSILLHPLNNQQFGMVLNAAAMINADVEKVNLLKTLIDKRQPNIEHFDLILDVIKSVGSNMDKAGLLKQLAATAIPEGETFGKLVDAVCNLGGDIDKSTMLTFLSNKDIRLEQQWISLINAVATISSDMDKTNLLVNFSRKMPQNDNVKTSYLTIAKTIRSDINYERAVRGVGN